jgi:hypothetical protein
MTQAVQKLVLDFEGLPEPERQQLLAELLRRAATEPHDLPNDPDLVGAAPGSRLAVRKAAGSFGSALMYQRKT